MCANSQGSGESERMRRLAWAFAGRLCGKDCNFMSWLNLGFKSHRNAIDKTQTFVCEYRTKCTMLMSSFEAPQWQVQQFSQQQIYRRNVIEAILSQKHHMFRKKKKTHRWCFNKTEQFEESSMNVYNLYIWKLRSWNNEHYGSCLKV